MEDVELRTPYVRSHVPQEAKALVQEVLTRSEVEQLFCQRGDPAVSVEDLLTNLQQLTGKQFL